MSIRTFWILLIRIMGLWFLFKSFFVTLRWASSFYYIIKSFNSTSNITGMAIISLIMVVFLLITLYCIFKANAIVNLLKLDNGLSDERIELNAPYSSVLNIAVIVIGGLLFIDSLPELCRQTFMFFQLKTQFKGAHDHNHPGWIAFYGVKTLIGYLLMLNSKWVVNLIDREKEKVIITA
jgi:hypothetical protein